jgi:hypothetical protein
MNKKDLAALGTQLGPRVTEAPARRADKQHYHNLQDVRKGHYSVAQQSSAARLTTHMHSWWEM